MTVNEGLPESLAQSIQDRLAASAVPGACVALYVDGQPAWSAGVGFQNVERTTALPIAARFPIYSVTKTLIAAAVLRLVDRGLLDLDVPFQAYLPGIPFTTPITLRRLLNHTGGVPDYGPMQAYADQVRAHPSDPWSADDYLQATLFQGLLFTPGQGWYYSNPGYLLLLMVIEAVTHRSLGAALDDLIFQPLHLPPLTVAQTLADMTALTPGYSAFFNPGGSLQDIRPFYHPGWVSHGLALASAEELAQVMDAVLAGPLLPPHLRAQMFDPVILNVSHPLFNRPAYGLGLMIDPESRFGVMVGHGGGGPGYSIGLLHFPQANGTRITSAALLNSDQGDLGLDIAFQAALTAAGA